MIKRVRGTQDVLNRTVHDHIDTLIATHFNQADFTHIQTPILEYVDLFHHSVGQATDIVSKEMYTFSMNQKETLCLRPEATAATMRAYLENGVTERPWKVFSSGPMFRYERPQKGRWREFAQFNAEIIGVDSITQDAQFILLLDALFSKTLQLDEYVLSLNFLGTLEDRTRHRTALVSFLDAHTSKLCALCQERKKSNILRIFDCKQEQCQTQYQHAPRITDHLSCASQCEWQQLTDLLDILSISYVHNPFLVRGLDYYHKTVFEFSSQLLGAQNAFCGGGQYDLASQLGYKQAIPSIGAAIGLGRLMLLLETAHKLPKLPAPPPLHIIIPVAPEQETLALLTHQTLLWHNIKSDIIGASSLSKALKKAHNRNAVKVLLIGEKEQAEEIISIKNMITGSITSVPHDQLVSFLQKQA